MAKPTYQIWANFSKDGDRSTPTTTSLFTKGQLMGDGVGLMEDFERLFAISENDTFELMHEFQVPEHEGIHTSADNWAIIRAMDDMFWRGWFKAREEDGEDNE